MRVGRHQRAIDLGGDVVVSVQPPIAELDFEGACFGVVPDAMDDLGRHNLSQHERSSSMVTLDRLATASAAEDWLGFDVANVWQDDRPWPISANDCRRVVAGQPHYANNAQRHPLSVPRYPWYY